MKEDLTSLEDNEIIVRILAGETKLFEVLVQRYQKHVFTIIMKNAPPTKSEDLAQEAFIRVYRSLPSYRRQTPLAHWLGTIAVRCCYDYWRRQSKSKELAISDIQSDEAENGDGQDYVLDMPAIEEHQRQEAKSDDRELLEMCLNMLSPEDRMALTLVHLEGYSVKEAARALGWSESNLKVRSHRAKLELRKILAEKIANNEISL
ncbi:MAG: RNA polymerase sigma factor [Candidatus Caenarcaniphilales bacterium]|nr:RNA polymerase sigma factor [Candidatus Caenarcaniphilales bacterium]